jgi:hypothetical protein
LTYIPAVGVGLASFPDPIRARALTVGRILSDTAPFLAAAVVTGGAVTAGWPEQTTQPGDDLPELLSGMGRASNGRPMPSPSREPIDAA